MAPNQPPLNKGKRERISKPLGVVRAIGGWFWILYDNGWYVGKCPSRICHEVLDLFWTFWILPGNPTSEPYCTHRRLEDHPFMTSTKFLEFWPPLLSTLGQLTCNVNPRNLPYFIHISTNPPQQFQNGSKRYPILTEAPDHCSPIVIQNLKSTTYGSFHAKRFSDPFTYTRVMGGLVWCHLVWITL